MSVGPRLILGDCLVEMAGIEDGSVDLICTDLPYGVTRCRWDVVIPFEPLWDHYRRILKPRGAVVLTATQPFTSMLVISNPKWFRYEWIWDKSRPTGHLNSRKRPMSVTENILVFSPGASTYNPQLRDREEKNISRTKAVYRDDGTRTYGKCRPERGYGEGRVIPVEKGYPLNLIRFKAIGTFGGHKIHPTQKPVPLFEYLIRTYSNPGEIVLDSCMGSGTTGVACLNTGRAFIGIEKDPAYFTLVSRRLESVTASTPLFAADA